MNKSNKFKSMMELQVALPSGDFVLPGTRLPARPGQLKFRTEDVFYRELRNRVDDYFKSIGKNRRDCPRMYLKTAVVLAWFAASYALLVFVVTSCWLAAPLTISLALSMAAIGFNIQHDGSHGAYSEHPGINKLMALTLDLLGGSSYGWNCKHNIIHHTYANIDGHDDDIDLGIFGRLSPYQQRFKFHQWQHFYLWELYGFLPIKWHFYDDFRDVVRGRIGKHRYPRPKGWDLVTFIGGKAVFFSLALGIPLLLHPIWVVLGFYVAVAFVQGLTLSVVFQLAHCVEQAAFPLPQPGTSRMEMPWSVHQVQTTVDYARENRLLSWFVGGLNFQIEHHLFPRICHVHYAALAPLVEQTCQEFGVNYQANMTFRSAIASHFRWLLRMGMPGTVQAKPARLNEKASLATKHELIAPATKINQIFRSQRNN
jgi:linoleoyl-CoA desaturase